MGADLAEALSVTDLCVYFAVRSDPSPLMPEGRYSVVCRSCGAAWSLPVGLLADPVTVADFLSHLDSHRADR